jgi:hypothetical protein
MNWLAGLAAGLLMLLPIASKRPPQSAAPARPAVPLEPVAAIVDAFRSHPLVAIGDAHGNVQGEAFQLALVSDPRFTAVANDILVEGGNSRYQDVVDRFIQGEDVSVDALQRVWLDTTQQQVASRQVPALFTAVRSINASLLPDRRLRVLLGEPPIDWSGIQTVDDLRKWEAEPMSNRDRFAVDLLRREVLAKNRRALALYGAGHFFRKVISESLITLLEGTGTTKAFTIWTNAAAEMSKMQSDVAMWPVPSLTILQGTTLGQIGLEEYFGPGGKDIPPQWRAPIQEQFDAVLYLGPLATITLARPQPWRCSDPAMPERLRRLALQRPALADRVKQECVR